MGSERSRRVGGGQNSNIQIQKALTHRTYEVWV